MRRVFITGMGVLSPVGNDVRSFWNSVREGQSGIGPITLVPADDLPVRIAGQVRDFDPSVCNRNERVSAKRMDRASQFAVAASLEALRNAGLPTEDLGDDVAVVIGSGLAGITTLQEQTEVLLTKGPSRVSAYTVPMLMPNAPPANVSLAFSTRSTAYTVASACSSAGHAMIDAFDLVREGKAEIVITGGAEASITRLSFAAFSNMRAMTKKYNDAPTKASRPFDANRDGFIMAEGSGILIFESEESVRRRRAQVLAEVHGFGATMDAYNIVQPDVEGHGAAKAIGQAIAMAGWSPSQFAEAGYVNAHGTSTKFNDLMETNALKSALGDDAKKILVSSTKSVTGHLIGAAGAVEMIATVLALREGVAPPTINYETPDPACDLDYVPNEARQAPLRYALNNTFGFGGHNVTIALSKFE